MPKNMDLPPVPSLKNSLGPSFILLGLSLGSGELILWPYLVSQYGLGIIWGGVVGITFQYFLNTEIMRYTLAWGESVFVGWRRWSRILPAWFIVSTVLPWALPGLVASSAAIINHVLPIFPTTAVAISLMLATGVILSSGQTLYRTMEKVQKTLLSVGIPFITLLTLYVARRGDWSALAHGLVGIGNGWRWFPTGIALGSFLGAFAYSGAGGNLNLAQSYYIKEKGFGMGAYMSGIRALLQGERKPTLLHGHLFALTASNRGRWQAWWRLVTREHGIVFWGIGLSTILLLGLLASATARGVGTSGGLSFFYAEGERIGAMTVPVLGSIFMLAGALMLFTTQLGILESATRITAENVLLLKKDIGTKVHASSTFYIFVWIEIILSSLYLLFVPSDPRTILTVGAILNAIAMMVAFPLTLLLSRSLPQSLRPSWLRQLILIAAMLFFTYFVFHIAITTSWR